MKKLPLKEWILYLSILGVFFALFAVYLSIRKKPEQVVSEPAEPAETARTEGGRSRLVFSAGLQAAAAGDPSGGAARFREVLAADPLHAASWYNLGRCLLEVGDRAEARSCFEKALSINDRAPQFWEAMGEFYFYAKLYREAADCYRRSDTCVPGRWAVLANLGVSEMAAGRRSKAVRAFSRMVAASTDAVSVSAGWGASGTLKALDGNLDGALADYRRAIEVDRGNVNARVCMGMVHARKGEYVYAREELRDALTMLESGSPLPQKGNAGVFGGIVTAASARRVAGLLADVDLLTGKFEEAGSLYRRYAASDDDPAEERRRKANGALVDWELQRFRDALAKMEQVLEAEPENPVFLYNHAVILGDAGWPRRAAAGFLDSLRARPDLREHVHGAADFLVRAGMIEEASRVLADSASRFPGDPEVIYRAAYSAYLTGDAGQLGRWAATLAVVPGWRGRARALAGVAYYIEGREAEALGAFEDACNEGPQSPQHQYNLGSALIAVRDFPRARRVLERGLGMVGSGHAAAGLRTAVGNCMYLQGDARGAVRMYRKVLSGGAANSEVAWNLQKALEAADGEKIKNY